MKICKYIFIFLILLINIIVSYGCNDAIGGLSINSNNTIINDTVFDTKNLHLIKSDAKGETNYAVKVVGNTTPLDNEDWNKWFGDEESDIAGKIAVCLRLKYSEEIANDPNATITMPDSTKNISETKTYQLSEITVDKNYIYIILNPKHDIATITIDYYLNNEHRDITYEIDMINVNSDSDRLG